MHPIGNYPARVIGKPVIWESEKGALMISSNFETAHGTVRGSQCIVQKDGTISEITVNTLREVFDWHTDDPFWIVDNGEDTECEVVVEHESYDGKLQDRVRYMNPPGGGTGKITPADPNEVRRKYGARFRALAGGKPVAATKKTAPKKATPPPAKKGADSSEEECWQAINTAMEGKDDGTISNEWFKLVESMFPNVPFSEITPGQWGRVMQVIKDDVPY